jgi:hypothetical protein
MPWSDLVNTLDAVFASPPFAHLLPSLRTCYLLSAGSLWTRRRPVGYHCNCPPGGSRTNICGMKLYPGLDIIDNPSIDHELDVS